MADQIHIDPATVENMIVRLETGLQEKINAEGWEGVAARLNLTVKGHFVRWLTAEINRGSEPDDCGWGLAAVLADVIGDFIGSCNDGRPLAAQFKESIIVVKRIVDLLEQRMTGEVPDTFAERVEAAQAGRA